jgi:peptidoglycan-associated lipoprotein
MTKFTKIGAIAALSALMAVGGCASVRSARDRIVKPQVRCANVTVQIYFEADSAELTSDGRAVLQAASGQAKACKVDSVSVVGLADAAGAPEANLALSARRADAVTRALAATGLPAAEFDKTAVGQQGAVTAAGDTRPLRRRADVTLKLSNP